jgi:PAS domain S-box-containing protein
MTANAIPGSALNDEAGRYELTYLRKDGSRVPAAVSVSALHDPKGEIVGYLLLAADHTQGKQIDDELRCAEDGFRLMVESITDCAIVQLDAQGQVLSWNAGAEIIDGYSAQEIVGQHFSRFYSAEDIELGAPQRDLDAAAATGRYETQGWRARKDGSTYHASIVLTSVHDEAGVLRGFARLTREVTELKPTAGKPEPALEPQPASGVPRCRLLYVEDHPANLRLVEQLIARRTDVLLLRAADPNLGIELARTARPEVILLNIDLPGISAIQFMKLLRADPGTQNTPLLALAANGAPDAKAKGLEAGFFHYLTKPLKPKPFLEALGDALEFAALERAENNDRPSRRPTTTKWSHQ